MAEQITVRCCLPEKTDLRQMVLVVTWQIISQKFLFFLCPQWMKLWLMFTFSLSQKVPPVKKEQTVMRVRKFLKFFLWAMRSLLTEIKEDVQHFWKFFFSFLAAFSLILLASYWLKLVAFFVQRENICTKKESHCFRHPFLLLPGHYYTCPWYWAVPAMAGNSTRYQPRYPVFKRVNLPLFKKNQYQKSSQFSIFPTLLFQQQYQYQIVPNLTKYIPHIQQIWYAEWQVSDPGTSRLV